MDITKIQAGRAAVKQQLFDRGLLVGTVEVETEFDTTGVMIRYRVSDVLRARVGGWGFEGGDSSLYKKIIATLPRPGKGLSGGVLRASAGRIRAICREAGYPLVEVTIVGVKESSGFLSPLVRIDTGPRVVIQFIVSGGDTRIPERLLIRYAGFRGPVGYSQRWVDLWRRGLERSGWIKVDSEELVMKPDSSYGVRYWVSALRTGDIYTALGYLSEERRLTGWARLRLFNISGSGRKMEAEWRSLAGVDYYHLGYTEPGIFRLPVDLTGDVEHTVIDTSYSFTTMGIVGTLFSGMTSFSTGMGFERTVGTLEGESKGTVWLSTGFGFDSRDRMINPRRGVMMKISTRAGARRTTGKRDLLTRVESELEPLFSLGRGFTLANRVVMRMVFAEEALSGAEQYRLGGAGSVRGYREGAFVTPHAGWWNCELRYNFSGGSQVHCFFDNGIYRAISGGYRWIAGYGAGGRWWTRVGAVGVDYGIARGESFSQGKIHLSFEAGF